ncbi:MAG: hypothetical protein C5B55_01685 [Blastocatellia bacterium]|nr:MAG: hypothetical protein C5B55_01685 [Blastocatellia bacterium]
MRQKLARSLVAVLGLVVFVQTTHVFACGPFSLDAIFVFTVHPSYPLERFAHGQVGVVQPTYARSYLYVAYRELVGSPFTEQEQKALVELWKDRLESRFDLGDSDWIKAWTDARQKALGSGEAPKIEVYRNREKPNEYESFVNCQKDAFDTAVKTLGARVAKYGNDNPVIRAWIEGQDQVFANCSEGSHIPQGLDLSADALARADRNYQIAAANFYSGNFDQAKLAFEGIASDSSSPWQQSARYLVARSLIRKSSLGSPDTRESSLTEAETELKAILSDRKLSALHESASRLSDLVRLRLHPEARLHELSETLLNKRDNSRIKQDLWDYTTLLDKYLEDEGEENKTKQSVDITSNDDLTDWIATIQRSNQSALAHSLEKWEATHSLVWLIGVLTKINGKDSQAPTFIAEALKVKAGSAGFSSGRFHAVRLMIESGKTTAARTLLDQLLKVGAAGLDESSLNLMRGQRMLLATNLNEFLEFAARKPAGLSWNDDGREVPAEASEISDESKALQGKALFDADAAKAINQMLPLSVLKEAAKSSALPQHLSRDLIQAAWIRAVLLGDNQTAEELVPSLKTLVPELSKYLDDFVAAPQPEAKRFAAIYAWLKFPGIEPVVDQGVPRTTPLNQQDIYRDNWWCSAAFSAPTESTEEDTKIAKPFTSDLTAAPSFLTTTERATARRERKALDALGAAPNYLCQQVVQWGSKNQDDPRVPEALHLAVNSTRHGCTDKQTGRWSKAAFDLLHRNYPKSPWTKKTPYWFKD